MPTVPARAKPRTPWATTGVVLCILGLLTIWSWQKWDTVWVERADAFFPPEWQNEDLETLAWTYPIYRSNDTYQWVRIADALAAGDHRALSHHSEEGPIDGRSNIWHSGLAHLLRGVGTLYASVNDWPTIRGIHASAHWLGSAIALVAIACGSCLLFRLNGIRAAISFALLYYFNAAINWDFAFSRLDHETLFQLCLLLQIIGVFGLLNRQTTSSTRWALLAGLGSAGCWWISATIQAAIGALTTLGCLVATFRNEEPSTANAKPMLIWGTTAALGILLACLVDHRGPTNPSIASLHPLFALTQFGACTVCAAIRLPNSKRKAVWLTLGLLAGLSPLLWMAIYQESAHTWFDPIIRRVHSYIIEFQSPFSNGVWKQGMSLQALLITGAAIFASTWKKPSARFSAVLLLGLLILSLLQTRWLGMLASVATISFCLSLATRHRDRYLNIALCLVFFSSWAWHWNRIEDKPGKIFVADMFLQVGARDINLNLDRYAGGSPQQVALPFAFAATSALFSNVHPLGTLYWENRDGIADTSALFATSDAAEALQLVKQHNIHYLAVQPNELGGPFVDMVSWTALESTDARVKEQSLGWRLSNAKNVPKWCEPIPFYGTFDPARFSMRIYRIQGFDN